MTSPIPATASPTVDLVGGAVHAAMTGDMADVAVVDGLDEQQAYAERSVTVGGTWDPDTESLTANQAITVTREQRGASRRIRETTSVSCIAYSGSGELDLASHRARVGAMITAIQHQLRQLAALPDGTPVSAQLTDQQWAQVIDQQGGGAMCIFTVAVVALP